MTQRTIVIIERDTVFAQTCAGEFQRNGYRVHLCTGTLVGVIDSLRQHVPSLILLNASAVSADLEEVIELLRLNTEKDTHIAVITDTSDANTSRYIRQLGADSVFQNRSNPPTSAAKFAVIILPVPKNRLKCRNPKPTTWWHF